MLERRCRHPPREQAVRERGFATKAAAGSLLIHVPVSLCTSTSRYRPFPRQPTLHSGQSYARPRCEPTRPACPLPPLCRQLAHPRCAGSNRGRSCPPSRHSLTPIPSPTPIPLVSQLRFLAMTTTAMAPAKAMTSVFASVPEAPADPILGLNAAFLADEAPEKISLGVGAFRTNEGKPYVLPVVKRVEQRLVRFFLRHLDVFVRGGEGRSELAVLRPSPAVVVLLAVRWLQAPRAWPAGEGGVPCTPCGRSLILFLAGLMTDRAVLGLPPLPVPALPPLSAPLWIVQRRRRIPPPTTSTCPLMACLPFKS